MPTTALVWFRNDLRLEDHEALATAAGDADRVLPVYCIDPRHFATTRWGFPKTGAFRVQFLLECLADLRAGLQDIGSDLVIRMGKPDDVLPELVRAYEISTVYVHEEVTSEEVAVEDAVEAALKPLGAQLRRFWGHMLYHRDDLPFAVDDLPNVFTPFRKRTEMQARVRAVIPPPDHLDPLPDGLNAGTIPTLGDLGLEAPPYDKRGVLNFEGGERAAIARLDAYLWDGDHLKRYKETRNGLLGADYSSKFSAWLAHGCISPRVIYEEVKAYEKERVKNNSTYWLVFELIWRDFFRFIAQKFGNRLFYKSGPMNVATNWAENDVAFERWTNGQTGFPFIDANMRELNATGFMSNRGRQNVASFFTKNLNLDWRRGAAWFEYLLIDYDVTSNWGNWAYVAGVGNDPRDRYFNIVKQARDYDKKAAFIKHWLPELRHLPTNHAHEPYKLTTMERSMYDLSEASYPVPMIDLDASYRAIRLAQVAKPNRNR